MSLCPVFGPSSPHDVRLRVLSFLSAYELCISSRVCSEWYKMHLTAKLWEPCLSLFGKTLYADVCKKDEGMKAKQLALKHLKDHNQFVLNFLGLVENDEQLAAILHSPSISLKQIREMPRIERNLFVIGELSKDSTEFVTSLVNGYFEKHTRESPKLQMAAWNLADVYHFSDKFFQNNRHLIVVRELLTNRELFPVNEKQIICLLVDSGRLAVVPARESVFLIVLSLLKSHPDLSELGTTASKNGRGTYGESLAIIPSVINDMSMSIDVEEFKADLEKCGLFLQEPDE